MMSHQPFIPSLACKVTLNVDKGTVTIDGGKATRGWKMA
jgi:hypothetical protein